MQNPQMKNSLIVSIIILVVVAVGLYLVSRGGSNKIMPGASEQLQISVIKEGSGQQAKAGDTVSVNYTGTFIDGKAFDSNVDPAFGHVQPFTFKLGAGMVIKGWDQGVVGMKVGEERKLVIDSSLAYGDLGIPGTIPPKSTLVFDVELLAIK
jgi:peptidylprolyl isomerase/FKBP-type peptidyl-prolyl cis-trans isomerase FkpA